MRILYFLGNGFDINLGMETRYGDFYKSYQKIESKSDVVEKLKNRISKDYVNWSDLELGLGDYTTNLESINEFDEIFEDVQDHLAEYLQLQENNFDFSNTDKDLFINDLIFPENYLETVDNIRINELRKNSNTGHVIDLVTFNYTKSVEKILKEDYTNLTFADKTGVKIKFPGVKHIHGYLDDRMVLGVNDETQVANSKFHSNQDILETIVKTECNKVLKHNLDQECKRLIINANLICIFGCSIGETDRLWWELIGNELRRKKSVIIFEKGEKIVARRRQKIGRNERKIKAKFLSRTNLSEEEKNSIADNIYVGINTQIFDIIKEDASIVNVLTHGVLD